MIKYLFYGLLTVAMVSFISYFIFCSGFRRFEVPLTKEEKEALVFTMKIFNNSGITFDNTINNPNPDTEGQLIVFIPTLVDSLSDFDFHNKCDSVFVRINTILKKPKKHTAVMFYLDIRDEPGYLNGKKYMIKLY